ncbi:MAG: 1-acyl-sn-glycerol-3-phosphate acyltransferase [Firmicutes bacterium]|nr:1-acyl-sn-glycerol-3-phosphate acyltransferase [Bacillota bacterium]
MLTILLILINLAVATLGVYLFDFQPDGIINSPLIIIASILIGAIVSLLVLAFYIELFYVLVAKTKPQNSMLKHKIAKQMVSFPMHLTNMRVKVIGLENLPKDPGFSVYSNHTSLMDISVLMYKLYEYPVAFLAKEMVEHLPLVGKWTAKLGCVFIDRNNDRKGAESIINVIKNVKSGSTMVVFPEGTRGTEIGTMLEFKQGAFKVAIKSKAPLVPISICKPKNYSRTIWPLPRKITLVIHRAISAEEISTMKSLELSEKVEKIIQGPLNEIYK